jgi:hypothetical protein
MVRCNRVVGGLVLVTSVRVRGAASQSKAGTSCRLPWRPCSRRFSTTLHAPPTRFVPCTERSTTHDHESNHCRGRAGRPITPVRNRRQAQCQIRECPGFGGTEPCWGICRSTSRDRGHECDFRGAGSDPSHLVDPQVAYRESDPSPLSDPLNLDLSCRTRSAFASSQRTHPTRVGISSVVIRLRSSGQWSPWAREWGLSGATCALEDCAALLLLSFLDRQGRVRKMLLPGPVSGPVAEKTSPWRTMDLFSLAVGPAVLSSTLSVQATSTIRLAVSGSDGKGPNPRFPSGSYASEVPLAVMVFSVSSTATDVYR